MDSNSVSNTSDGMNNDSDDASIESECASNKPGDINELSRDNVEISSRALSSSDFGMTNFLLVARKCLELLCDSEEEELLLKLMELDLHDQEEEESSSSLSGKKRRYIDMGRKDGDVRLWNDYFGPDPSFDDSYFRQKFRMRRVLFDRIVEGVSNHSSYFTQRYDGLDKKGVSPLQKCICAMRQLAYGTSGDQVDEYIRIAERTANECLQEFCRCVVEVFGDEYLRKPNPSDIQRLLERHSTKHGFPGMLGSIDCMHWAWENCLDSFKSQYTRGVDEYPTIMLEAAVSQDLWIWHAYFGVTGSNNDINMLNQCIGFNHILNWGVSKCSFIVNETEYTQGYYLADDIYPKCVTLVKSFTNPKDPKSIKFKQRHESARKDVVKAFEVLQARWAIVRGVGRGWSMKVISDILYTCIILHNMIVENEGSDITNWSSGDEDEGEDEDDDDDDNTDESDDDSSVCTRGAVMEFEHRLKMFDDACGMSMNHQLRQDLMEHIWNLEN